MNLEETIYVSSLYNIYGKLLTLKQQQIFENYIFENLSLAEIAENVNISRQAVLDCVNKCCFLLKKYEQDLCVFQNNNKIKSLLLNTKTFVTDKKLLKQIDELLNTL